MTFLRTMGVSAVLSTLGFVATGYAAEVAQLPTQSAAYSNTNQFKSVTFQQTVRNHVKESVSPINVVASSQDSQTFQERAQRKQ